MKKYIRIDVDEDAWASPITIHDSDTVSKVIELNYPRNYGESVSKITFKIVSSANDAELVAGRQIRIWHKDTLSVGNADGDRIFKGYIEEVVYEGKIITVNATDYIIKAQWTRGTTALDYETQTSIKTIFSALCTAAGLSASNSATATSPVNLEKFYSNNINLFDRMMYLANITGWYFYYDPTTTNTVKFQPKSELALQSFTVGTNLLGLPKWNNDPKDLLNDITVIGGNNKVAGTWSDTPDGGSWYPLTDLVPRKSGTSIPNGAVTGSGTTVGAAPKTSWTYPGEYVITKDATWDGIWFYNGFEPDNGVGTLSIDFSYQSDSDSDNVVNAGSETTYQTRQKAITKRDIVHSTDLTSYATNMVSDSFWGKPIDNVVLQVNTKIITPILGSKADVTDSISGRSITYASNNSIVTSIIESWPAVGTKVVVSTKPVKNPLLLTNVQDTVDKFVIEWNKIEQSKIMRTDGATPFQDDIDFGWSEANNFVIQKVADAITRGNIEPHEGQIVYQQDNDTAYIYDGAAWDAIGSGAGGDHSLLSNLTWSTAGHIINANIDMNDNNITEANEIQATASQNLTLKVSTGSSIVFQAI